VKRIKRQRYSKEFRRQAVERANACGNIVGLDVDRGTLLATWHLLLIRLFQQPTSGSVRRASPAVSQRFARVSPTESEIAS
jgi:hypothetical protein